MDYKRLHGESGDRAVSDLAILERLHEFGNYCVGPGHEFEHDLDVILDAAIFITAADKGNIQLHDPIAGGLVIAAQRGFQRPFLEFFSVVEQHKAGSCAAAFEHLRQVIVEDVALSEIFAATPSLAVLQAEGVGAVLSTPLVSSIGGVLGVISTHFTRPTRLTDRELRFMDLLARQSADYLERKQNEKALAAKQRQLERIATRVPILITQCSRDLRYVFVNDSCARFLGKSSGEIVGRPIVEVLGEAAFQTIRPFIDRVLAGERVEYETEIAYSAAGSRLMHATYVPDIDAQGTVLGWIATLIDVTERRHAERTLRKREQEVTQLRADLARAERVNALGQLASGLAHELMQPLTAILANTEAAELQLNTAEPDLKDLAAILKDIRDDDTRAVETIDRMRALLKRGTLDMQPLGLDELLQDVSLLMRSEAVSRRVSLDSVMDSGLPRAWGDRVQVSQVLINLILNAMEAMQSCAENARRIHIAARVLDGHVEVAVSDSGPGISAGNIDRVFDPLFSTKAEGLGMGLAISRSIIEAHGGRLWAENRTDASGATFRFTLAVALERTPRPRRISRRRGASAAKTIVTRSRIP